MSHPRTCVILVNYKGAGDTAACVSSLRALPQPSRIVVVDNTPDDPELEPALALYPDVHLIRALENLGFGRGNNLGIDWALAHTDCEFIFILNNDATVEPGSISNLEEAMDAYPEAGIVTPRIVLAEDPTKLWYGGGEIAWYRGGGKVPGFDASSKNPHALEARYVHFASGCAMLLRRALIMRTGMFDSRFFMYEEDVNLCIRADRDGWRIWYEPMALVLHNRQGSLRHRSREYQHPLHPRNPNLSFFLYNIIRNRVINGVEYAEGAEKMVFFVGFPLFLLKLFSRYVANGNFDTSTVIFRAVRDGFIACKRKSNVHR